MEYWSIEKNHPLSIHYSNTPVLQYSKVMG